MYDRDRYSELKELAIDETKIVKLLDEEFTARDLITALHWTSKEDLKQCLDQGENLDEYWDNLVKADRALQQFYAVDLARIIKLNHDLKQHEK